mmetsp:Transcript_16868/g.42989  ORF Transcript_16868/g.42989 Transcript_16868/m.42989 type:complete len:252 (-) Transcript_16868:237-992(-)
MRLQQLSSPHHWQALRHVDGGHRHEGHTPFVAHLTRRALEVHPQAVTTRGEVHHRARPAMDPRGGGGHTRLIRQVHSSTHRAQHHKVVMNRRPLHVPHHRVAVDLRRVGAQLLPQLAPPAQPLGLRGLRADDLDCPGHHHPTDVHRLLDGNPHQRHDTAPLHPRPIPEPLRPRGLLAAGLRFAPVPFHQPILLSRHTPQPRHRPGHRTGRPRGSSRRHVEQGRIGIREPWAGLLRPAVHQHLVLHHAEPPV